MSRIKVYDTHTEIINGLFIDIPDEEFTFLSENLNIIPRVQRQVRVPASRNIIRDEAEGLTMEQFEASYPRTNNTTTERALNEEIWHQVRNMSEEETIQYFDRISQEE